MRLPVLAAYLVLLISAWAGAYGAVGSCPTMLIVVGAPGEARFASDFVHQARLWTAASAGMAGSCRTLGIESATKTNDWELLRQAIDAEPKEGAGPLWLVLIGHGSFDGHDAKFNLRGPDMSADELAQWLAPFRRLLVVVNASSASAPFLTKLSATNRVILTATRSGHELNFPRFGGYLAESIVLPGADLDKDGQVSLLEAFLAASRSVAEFYKVEGRLATEHALVDDNGDGLGTPADWFRGVRAVKRAKDDAAPDGLLAGQICLVPSTAERQLGPELLAERDALERAIFALRARKAQLAETEYYRQLERLLLDFARFYARNMPEHE